MQDATPYKGADFGNALHLVLEHARALDWPGGRAGPAALRHCRQALLDFGYAPEMAEQGVPVLAELAANTLLAPLPEGPCLLDLPAADKRHELEFHLKLEQADSAQILALLHRHGYCRKRERFGFNRVLNGLLTGKIDLLYRYAGKAYIVDYKSNTLPEYSPNALRQSIDDQEYDLQYLLYTVAVNRWLALRMHDYAYDRHFGGIRYLYARGLDPAVAGSGIYSDRPAESLVAALDRCFSPGIHGHD
jgi:exodeoxyribonuclease V beta subunit